MVFYSSSKEEVIRFSPEAVATRVQYETFFPKRRKVVQADHAETTDEMCEYRGGSLNPPFIYFLRCKEISREAMINEEIRAKELRVIAADGTQFRYHEP